jgi:hypothetical protein
VCRFACCCIRCWLLTRCLYLCVCVCVFIRTEDDQCRLRLGAKDFVTSIRFSDPGTKDNWSTAIREFMQEAYLRNQDKVRCFHGGAGGGCVCVCDLFFRFAFEMVCDLRTAFFVRLCVCFPSSLSVFPSRTQPSQLDLPDDGKDEEPSYQEVTFSRCTPHTTHHTPHHTTHTHTHTHTHTLAAYLLFSLIFGLIILTLDWSSPFERSTG